MLLAIVDERGPVAAAALFERAKKLLGAPCVQVGTSLGFLGAWGPTTTAGPDCVIEGTARTPTSDRPRSLFDRAVEATGDFALVGADPSGVVLTSGGAGGYRPIYLGVPRRGRIVASTSMELICRLTPEEVTVDADVLAAYATAATMFSTAPPNPEGTAFQGVKCLPMYETWQVKLDGNIRRKTTFHPFTGACLSGPGTSLAQQMREAVCAAVLRSMQGQSRIGVMVSGGLDSSSLLAVAQHLIDDGKVSARLDAFAWDYATYYGDDRPYLSSLTRHLGIEPHRTSPRDAGSAVGATFIEDGMPFYGMGAPLLAALSRGVRQRDVKILLTGIGGDDVLDGTPALLSELVTAGYPLRAIARAILLRGPCMGGPAWRVSEYVLRPMVRAAEPSTVRRMRHKRGLLRHYPWAGPRLRRYFRAIVRKRPGPDPRLDWTPGERFEAMARSPFLLRCCMGRAQEEAIAGCTRRDPFFDEEFLRFVASVPPLALLHGNFRRGLLREAMCGLIPEDVRLRQTKAMMEPALHEMVEAAGGFGVLEHLADVRLLADLGIAEPRRFRESFDALARDPDRRPWIGVWPALAAEAFLRQQNGSHA